MSSIHDFGRSFIPGANTIFTRAKEKAAELSSQIEVPSLRAPLKTVGSLPKKAYQKVAYGIPEKVDLKATLKCLNPKTFLSEHFPKAKSVEKHLGEQRKVSPYNPQINTGLTAKIKQILGAVAIRSGFNIGFIWQTHLHAEHMSQGNLSGNSHVVALNKTLKVLKHMEPPKEESEKKKFDNLIKALSYAEKVTGELESPLNLLDSNSSLASSIKKDIAKLTPGESLAIPSDSRGHAMLMLITKQQDGTFKVVQHNEGEGINQFHYFKVGEDGKKRYQTALEIENVLPENICGEDSTFINQLLENRGKKTEELYTNVIPLLKGKICNPSNDPRLWSHGQLGGSCTTASCVSLIRSQLGSPENKEPFKKFREVGRSEMVLKSFEQIRSGWGNNAAQRTVTLEVVKKLEHSLQKQNRALPPELKEIKKQLEAMQKARSRSNLQPSFSSSTISSSGSELNASPLSRTSSTIPPLAQTAPPIPTTLNGIEIEVGMDKNNQIVSKRLADNVNIALTILRSGNFDDESIQEAQPYITQVMKAAEKAAEKTEPMSEAEIKTILDAGKLLADYCKDRPLTKEQIVVMAAFSGAILRATANIPHGKNLEPVHKFFWDMHGRYNALNLGAQFKNSFYEKYIAYFQAKNFPQTGGSVAPKELLDLLERQRENIPEAK